MMGAVTRQLAARQPSGPRAIAAVPVLASFTLCMVALFLLCLVLAPSALAASSATKTITTDGDTWVRDGLTTAQWSTTTMRVGRDAATTKTQRTFVRFPQATVDDLRSKNVVSAVLRIYGVSVKPAFVRRAQLPSE